MEDKDIEIIKEHNNNIYQIHLTKHGSIEVFQYDEDLPTNGEYKLFAIYLTDGKVIRFWLNDIINVKNVKMKMTMNDKLQHFIVGFVLSITGIVWFPLIMLGFVFGVGKEFYDEIIRNSAVGGDWLDLVATFAGATLATLLVVMIIWVSSVNIVLKQ